MSVFGRHQEGTGGCEPLVMLTLFVGAMGVAQYLYHVRMFDYMYLALFAAITCAGT